MQSTETNNINYLPTGIVYDDKYTRTKRFTKKKKKNVRHSNAKKSQSENGIKALSLKYVNLWIKLQLKIRLGTE